MSKPCSESTSHGTAASRALADSKTGLQHIGDKAVHISMFELQGLRCCCLLGSAPPALAPNPSKRERSGL